MGCEACERRAAGVRAAFEAFAREADTGLLARLRWGAFRDKVLGAAGGGT